MLSRSAPEAMITVSFRRAPPSDNAHPAVTSRRRESLAGTPESTSVPSMTNRLTSGLLRAPLVVLGVVALTFLLLHLAPGDPVLHLVGPNATADQIAATTRSLGLDRPVVEQ